MNRSTTTSVARLSLASPKPSNSSALRDEFPEFRTTWTAVLVRMAVCLALALGLYAGTIALVVNPYILKGSHAGRVVGVYEGYRAIKEAREQGDHTKELVLFWGSSMVREGVDAQLLETTARNIAAYNLAVSGDIPYRRLVELPLVTEVHPDLVVLGLSYPELFENRPPFEDQISVLPASAYRRLPAAAQELMSPHYREVAERSEWKRFWRKRKFVLSAAFWKLGVMDGENAVREGYYADLKQPAVYTRSLKYFELKRFLDQRRNHYPPYTENQPVVFNENPSVRSLELLLENLRAHGTRIVLVNMPLHPLLSQVIPAERRAALNGYLQSLASSSVLVRDFQDRLPAEDFTDLVHVNARGRAAFTQSMGQLLTQHQGSPKPPAAALTGVSHAF